jgi:hypothetical protein
MALFSKRKGREREIKWEFSNIRAQGGFISFIDT